MTGAAVARVLGVSGAEPDLVEVTRKGLPAGSALRLAAAGGLSMAQLAAALGISGRTLARKKGRQTLSAVESDRAVRLARVLALALEVFANRKNAVIAWLHAPGCAESSRCCSVWIMAASVSAGLAPAPQEALK